MRTILILNSMPTAAVAGLAVCVHCLHVALGLPVEGLEQAIIASCAGRSR